MVTILLFILGLAILTGGAELLVRGASSLSTRLGIPSLIVGLTVVAFGTSAPEMAVSIKSALLGQADLAVGNVVGSNIFNILFILGISAAIVPLSISRQLLRVDLYIMVATALVAWLLALNGTLGRFEGLLLFLGILAYVVLQIILARKEGSTPADEQSVPLPRSAKAFAWDVALAVIGLVMLVYGARLFVDSSVTIARYFGISELVIGLTIVAAGTSMPEVAASVMASIRGHRDLAVGNVVGSNIFNILAVLGASAIVSPMGIAVSPSALKFDFPIMLLVSLICIPIFITGKEISRKEGLALLSCYIGYTALLILIATGRMTLPW
ncbi:MAG: calcium/sodium antiporter [Sumerlaeia bacterium]